MLPTHRPPSHPGGMLLKEFLEPLGVWQVEARRMNIPFERLNAIVKGRCGVSEMHHRLNRSRTFASTQ